jgi:transposase
VYVMGLSFEKVCATLGFLQNLKLGKTQVDCLLHQLARHWRKEFEILCTLLANSLVAYADETSWSINSVWVFLSEKARVLLYGVNKTTATLLALLDPKVFAGILISDDYAVYANFSKAQKCWAHLLRKAIKLTLEDPENEAYRGLTDELLDIYRQACRAKSDGRLGEAGRAGKVAALTERLEELCGDGLLETSGLTGAELDYRRLQNEIVRLSLRQQLFTFVTAAAVLQPNGESQEVAGTNNVTERENRNPAQAREMGRGNKSVPGARRQTIVVSVLASLRLYVTEYTLGNVVREILSWWQAGESCFAKLLQKMKLQVPEASVLDKVLPIPESS